MRTHKAPISHWSFADDGASQPSAAKDVFADQPFDSFGPVSDIRRALNMPMRPTVTQAPHDFTRILVAEHDAFHRRVLRVLLSSPRMSVIEVEEGQAAIDLLALRSFDLLILDLTLPLMTGEDVIRWIRRNHTPWSDIPILGLVDDSMKSEVGRMMSMGMTDWTAKPLSRHHLADKIVHLMPALFDAGL